MIKDLINKHLPKAFDNQLKDAVQLFTGKRQGERGEYNIETGRYEQNAINYTGRGVFGQFSTEETKDTEIRITDTKLTVLVIEVSKYPQVDDVITLGEQELRVLNIMPDPTDTVLTVQLRGLKDVG